MTLSTKPLITDILIIGGGIAGLWSCTKLRQLGYSVIVLEKEQIGSGQTIKSQGIIHGGTKYSLHGALSLSAQAISNMPNIWRSSLNGTGDIDLQNVKILSHSHYLWSAGNLAGNLMSFFASNAMRTKVKKVTGKDAPIALQNNAVKGPIYQLNELVLDVPSLLQKLTSLCAGSILQSQKIELTKDSSDLTIAITDEFNIKAQCIVLTAGGGNQDLISSLNLENPPAQQSRPLHMVLAKDANLQPIYAHCLDGSPKPTPRLTITTHYAADGLPVWYLGGELAESGINRNQDEQITFAKNELKQLMPWLDLSAAKFASFMVDRFEPAQKGKIRPDEAFVEQHDNYLICWPTKLALAPDVANKIVDILTKEQITHITHHHFPEFPTPTIAKPIWDELL